MRGSSPSKSAGVPEAGMHLELRCFTRDRAAADRLLALLGLLQGVCPHRLNSSAASELVPYRGSGCAAVFLVDSHHLVECNKAVRTLRIELPGVPLILCSQGVGTDHLTQLLACGATDFATLESSDADIALRLRHSLGLLPRPLQHGADAALLPATLQSRLIGRAPEFVKAVRHVPAIAAADANVLLLGETGTGKEVCAQALHYHSPRSARPWVATNCAAVPAELLEDELFGHVRGAYTHAVGPRDGLVQEAEGGTLFLDEVDSMPLAAQAKLLRFLQDKLYRRVGSNQQVKADVRVVAASNRNLRLVAAQGGFRQDLFFRLNVLSLTLPPLRERREDIALLAMHFLEQTNREAGRQCSGITPAALSRLLMHPWPGNVRELKHVIQRAVLLAQGTALHAEDIELDGASGIAEAEPGSFREAKARAVESFERHYLEQLLLESDGNISQAARAAQKNRRAFFELLRRYGIDADNYRGA